MSPQLLLCLGSWRPLAPPPAMFRQACPLPSELSTPDVVEAWAARWESRAAAQAQRLSGASVSPPVPWGYSPSCQGVYKMPLVEVSLACLALVCA